MAVLGEPLLASCVVGQHSFYTLPEIFAVMRLYEVDQLMNDNVLDYPRRQADGTPVDVKVALRATGAPTVAEFPDVYRCGCSPDPVDKEVCAPPYPGLTVADVPGNEVLSGAMALVAAQLEPATMQAKGWRDSVIFGGVYQ